MEWKVKNGCNWEYAVQRKWLLQAHLLLADIVLLDVNLSAIFLLYWTDGMSSSRLEIRKSTQPVHS